MVRFRSTASRLLFAALAMQGTLMPLRADDARATAKNNWSQLAPIPDPLGVAGPYVGVAGEALIVAGGANFAGGVRPWNGGVKTWHDTIFLLDKPAGPWRTSTTRLPRPLGYGTSISTPEGLWCIGGCDRERHYADVFVLRRTGGEVEIVPQPSLPVPLAYSCGALVGGKLIVAGGTQSPTATRTENHFFELDTTAPSEARQWKSLGSWPGPGRMLAAAGTDGHDFYLFGGVQLKADAAGAPERIKPFLSDAYVFTRQPDNAGKWARLPDLPAPRAACPTPAPILNHLTLGLFFGDDGSLTAALEDRHTGFPATVLAYDMVNNRWFSDATFPRHDGPDPASKPEECLWPSVTTGTAVWEGRVVIPSGEIRPGVRTRRVLSLPVNPAEGRDSTSR